MNKLVTTQEDILAISKKFILENGLPAFNIRAIAKECGISIGAVYNYFPSKSALITAAVESVWTEIFEPLHGMDPGSTFVPVSYTHLDVYKRQMEAAFSKERSSSIFPYPFR